MAKQTVKHILIIDDETSRFEEILLKKIYPSAQISAFEDLETALAFLTNTCPPQNRPDVFMLDCSNPSGALGDMGTANGNAIVEWYRDTTGSDPTAQFIFISEDADTAADVKNQFQEETSLPAIASETRELERIVDSMGKRHRAVFGEPDEHGFRAFFNITAGLRLPVTQDEVDRHLIEQKAYEPRDLLRMVKSGTFPVADGLLLLYGLTKDAVAKVYQRQVRMSKLPDGLFPNDAKTCFKDSLGQPVTGYVAYRIDDVQKLAAEGKKSVLVLSSYQPDFAAHLKHIAGVVLVNGEGTGHLKMLLQSHNVSGLFGMSQHKPAEGAQLGINQAGNTYARFDGQIKTHRIINPSGNYDDVGRHLARMKELYPDYQNDDVPFDFNKVDRAMLANIHTVIETGTPVTLDVSRQSLFACHLPVEDEPSTWEAAWLKDFESLLEELKEEHGITTPHFKANLDSAAQLAQALPKVNEDGSVEINAAGIGLVRTEHMVLTSAEQMAAIKDTIFRYDETAYAEFTRLQAAEFVPLLAAMNPDFPVRIRLLDAPPAEFFDAEELFRFTILYGDKNLRGVQLAINSPAPIYETQIEGIFTALKQVRAAGAEILPVEIMVPTVRTKFELHSIKIRTEMIAGKQGLTEEDYRFGSMLETLDACRDIEKIAPLCDFISIGSNDLTSEVLDCARDDWAKRRELTIASGKGADPFLKLDERVLDVIGDAVERARAVKPDLQVDICGEHASDLESLLALAPLELSGASMRPTTQNLRGLRLLYDAALVMESAARERRPAPMRQAGVDLG